MPVNPLVKTSWCLNIMYDLSKCNLMVVRNECLMYLLLPTGHWRGNATIQLIFCHSWAGKYISCKRHKFEKRNFLRRQTTSQLIAGSSLSFRLQMWPAIVDYILFSGSSMSCSCSTQPLLEGVGYSAIQWKLGLFRHPSLWYPSQNNWNECAKNREAYIPQVFDRSPIEIDKIYIICNVHNTQ